MSTDIAAPKPQASPLGRLYRGKGDASGNLMSMVAQGRELAKTERSRWQMNRYMYRGEQWMRARPGTGFSSGRLELLMDTPRARRRAQRRERPPRATPPLAGARGRHRQRLQRQRLQRQRLQRQRLQRQRP